MAEILSNGPVYTYEDWDDDGAFAEPYDDLSADLIPSISIDRGRDQGRVIGGPKVPSGSFMLTNESRRYATEYSGSPLHGLLTPGHRCEIGRLLGNDDVTMGDPDVAMGDPNALMGGAANAPLLTGFTEEPDETYGLGRRTVQIEAYGITQRLVETTISIGYQAAITTGAAMVMAWEAAGLVNGVDFVVDADEIANGFTLQHWYVDSRKAWDVTRQIWATAGPPSAVYERASGVITFEGKNYRQLTDRCLTVQQSFTDDAADDAWHVDIQYKPSYASVINTMSLTVEQRAVQALQQVWQYTGPLVLGISESRTIIASNDSGDPWINVVTPASPTDFTVSAGSLASVTVTVLSPFAVRVVWVAGAGGATISPVGTNTGWSLQAQPITVLSTLIANGTIDTTDSVAAYGAKGPPGEVQGAIWPGLSMADANGLIDGYLGAYPNPRGVVTVTLEAATGLILWEVMRREISDRIFVSDRWSGIGLDVTIEQIVHLIEADTAHRCVLTCERVVQTTWGRWDSARWDISVFGQ